MNDKRNGHYSRSPHHVGVPKENETFLSAETEAQLDSLLTQWAAQHRLSVKEENSALQGITVIRREMGDDWWKQLFSRYPFQSDPANVPGLSRLLRLNFPQTLSTHVCQRP